MPSKPSIPATCAHCGNSFLTSTYDLSRGRKYCSISCGSLAWVRPSIEERLARHLVSMPTGCVDWQAGRDKDGYGILYFHPDNQPPLYKAHRVAWFLVNGPIPEGLLVCHSCDNPPCCNVDHLFLGTVLDNSADMRAKLRGSRGERNKLAKFTDADILMIRKRYSDGDGPTKIASDYNVNRSTIKRIVRRTTWIHIP